MSECHAAEARALRPCWMENVTPKLNTPSGADGATDAGENEGTREAARVVSNHQFLLDFLEENPVKDPDAFLEKLTRRAPPTAFSNSSDDERVDVI